MSQPSPEPPHDAQLDANLSRLLQLETRTPQLPPEAEARMLAALVARQAELATTARTQAEEPTVSRATTISAAPSPKSSRFAYAALACLLLVVVIGGALLWNQPPAVPPADLVQQTTVPSALRFDTGKLVREKLADGTIVIAQSGTKFKVAGPRKIELQHGDLYLIVAKTGEPFVVSTASGEVIATGTRFAVSAGGSTSAAVAQGNVTLKGNGGSIELSAGEQGELRKGEKPTRRPAPRLSYLVSWAKEALAQEERLIEKAESENGLVALDPWGQQTQLSLRKYHVDIYIEDGIARTTIDQTFFNHNPWMSEGTFYFPLPPDASVSRLAMYVAGQLNEGGMVERSRGQQIYNDILHQRRDPALLEMMEGNVFKMRIFPLEGRQEKRIFLSYTQNLEELYGTLRYWFPMDHTHSVAGVLSIRVHIKDGAKLYVPQSSTHKLQSATDGGDLILTYDAAKVRPDQDLLLHLVPSAQPPATRVATCEKDGQKFLFARFAPEIPGAITAEPRQWIVVNDVSASRSKIDLAAQRYVLERLIAEADDDDTLLIINLNTRAELLSKNFVPIHSADAEKLIERAAASPRLGATNLVAGMETAAKIIETKALANPHILYLGDGVATDGSTEAFEPARAVPRGATFVGIGVGKKVDALFLQEAANRTGGVFTTINPDEDIDWRVFDLVAALNTPRLLKINVELQDATGKPVKAIAYPSALALAHGETLSVVARCEGELPAKVVLSGQVNGKAYRSVADVAASPAEYIPRLWAKRHIDELLKSDMSRQQEIIQLSQQYYVVTPLTSLIVLENDAMYEQYNVERGRKDHWALYPAPAKIEVVQEPVDWSRWGWYGAPASEDQKITAKAAPQTVREIVDSVQLRIDAPFYYWQPTADNQSRYAFYHTLDSKAQPTRLLAWWLLVAAGQRQAAAEVTRHPQTTATTPTGSEVPSATTSPSPLRGYFVGSYDFGLIVPGQMQARGGAYLPSLFYSDESDGWLSGKYGKKMAFAPRVTLMDDSLSMAGDEAMPLPLIVSQRQSLPMSLLPMAKELQPASLLAGAPQGEAQFGLGSGLRPELLHSFDREWGRRWERIERDVREFNRQYGYWDGWGNTWSMRSDSLDLSRSFSGRWHGGLDEIVKTLSDGTEASSESSTPHPAISMLITELVGQGQGQSQGGSLAGFGSGGPRWPMAFAWLGALNTSLEAVPGTSSVLAADHLVSRRAELADKARSPEEDVELKAIDHALMHLGAAAARLEDTSPFWSDAGWNYRPQPWTFQPPTVQVYQGYNWSFDLTRYTPALHSNSFDVLCEVASQFGAKPEGSVDERARAAIAAARKAIAPVKIRFADEGPELLVAAGDRFALTRRTDMQLVERMVCDGEQIVHQYEELGLAARRSATPLRLAALRRLAPHLVEPSEALALRSDVKLAAESDDDFTLELTPIGQPADAKQRVLLTLRVGRDGRLHEQRITVDGKLLVKLAFDYLDDKVIAKWTDADEKQLAESTYSIEALGNLDALACDTSDYVVVDMPLRKASYYEQQLRAETEIDSLTLVELQAQINLHRHRALALIQQLEWRRWGSANSEAVQSMTQVLALAEKSKLPLQVGDATLMGSGGGQQLTELFENQPSIDATHSVLRYYRLRDAGWGDARKEFADAKESLLGHLAAFNLCIARQQVDDDYKFFAETYPESPLLLAATYYAASWGRNPPAWQTLYDNPRWQLLAMMMATPHVQTDDDRRALAAALAKYYGQQADEKRDVPITSEMVAILRQHDEGQAWRKIVEQKFDLAVAADQTSALLKFAEQALVWAETSLADKALALARERLAKQNSLSGRMALAQTYWAGGRVAEAEKLYEEILDELGDKNIAPSPGLLSAAARLAQQHGDVARAIDLEEQALAAEHPYLPDLINLQAFRERYKWLWQQYETKVGEAVAQGNSAFVDHWLARADATWQQWREVDPDNNEMISEMAALQATAGRDADAWLYLSTIIDQHPRDAQSYGAISYWHRQRGEFAEAEVWLARAYPWDTANPQWLLLRAQLLDQLDRRSEARKLYQQIVDGQWAQGLQGYVEEAKKAL